MRHLSHLILASVLTLMLCSTLPMPAAYAAGMIVNSLTDEIRPANGECTLREALQNANANSDATRGDCAAGNVGPDIITFSVVGYIVLNRDFPPVTDSLTIIGPTHGVGVTVDGNGKANVFLVSAASVTLTLQNLNISNTLSLQGGAINNNRGTVNVQNATFSNNKANANGGAIFNGSGTLHISQSTFRDNSAMINGGAVHLLNGTMTISNSSFANNNAAFGGGGLSILSGNTTLSNNTFYGNFAKVSGGGIYAGGGNTMARNTIIANNTGHDCAGFFGLATLANIDTDGSCGAGFLTATPEQLQLAPLANNGGHTQTFALKSGSLAINNGDAAACASALINNLDQRGARRTFICDIGAFESTYASTTTTLTVSANPANAGQAVTLMAAVKSPNGIPSGMVIFREDDNPLGIALLNNGQATFVTSTFNLGSHAVTATYNGDSEFNVSVSTALPVVVNAARTSTILLSAINPSPNGQAATLIAIIEKTSPEALSGTVTFKNDDIVIKGCEKVTLVSNAAICVTRALTFGKHELTALYNGDSQFNSSVSEVVLQTVSN